MSRRRTDALLIRSHDEPKWRRRESNPPARFQPAAPLRRWRNGLQLHRSESACRNPVVDSPTWPSARPAGERTPRRAFLPDCGTELFISGVEEVRKTVTVVFCDLVGSTALGERLDPESVRRAIGRYFDEARVAIERHGGTVEKFIGDAVMSVFGIPRLHEDDALRAVRAAAELRDAVDRAQRRARGQLGVRIEARSASPPERSSPATPPPGRPSYRGRRQRRRAARAGRRPGRDPHRRPHARARRRGRARRAEPARSAEGEERARRSLAAARAAGHARP